MECEGRKVKQVAESGENWRAWRTNAKLWEKLQPLARMHRRQPTKAELALWEKLRGRRFRNARFRRQHTIERFIADFFCSEAKLIIEVDGGIHQYTAQEDAIRREFLEWRNPLFNEYRLLLRLKFELASVGLCNYQ